MFSVSYDEALNKDFENEQMDVTVHYFHEDRIHEMLLLITWLRTQSLHLQS